MRWGQTSRSARASRQIWRLDRPLAELLGRPIEELWPAGFGEVLQARQQLAWSGPTSQTVEEFPFRYASRPVRVVRFPWRGPAGEVEGVVELFEEHVLASQAEIVGRLALGVAHDFNNALTLMHGHLDLLQESTTDSRMLRQLSELRLVIEHAAQLPQQMVRFIQGGGRGAHRIDLNALLSSLERLLRPRLGKVSLRLELAAGGAWVEGDPVQVTQVLLNIAGNALDAMPSGGQLLLRCERLPGSEAEAGQAGPQVRLTIRDSGEGMTQEVQRHLFEPLFTTRRQGNGLGLAVVQEMVKRHGGSVQVMSEAGQGTTFIVLLPARGSSRRAAAEPSAGAAVLVLDRNPDIRQLAGMILAHGRFTPLLCADFHEARLFSHNPQRPIRLIIVDAELCSGQREEQLHELLRRHGSAGLLYTSAGERVPVAVPGLPTPGIIHKPFRAEQLLRAVEAALAE